MDVDISVEEYPPSPLDSAIRDMERVREEVRPDPSIGASALESVAKRSKKGILRKSSSFK
jgi:hypothetical protein